MDLGVLIPIIAIASSAIITVAIFQFIIRLKTIEAAKADTAPDAENQALQRENRDLKLVIERMEQRLAVLERIATDPAERTAREIEQLR